MLKPLYYLQYARSIKNGKIIPAKKLQWGVPSSRHFAYQSKDICDTIRLNLQPSLSEHIVRVRKASFLKNLWIRLDNAVGDGLGWFII